jgi:hypothetical protein
MSWSSEFGRGFWTGAGVLVAIVVIGKLARII